VQLRKDVTKVAWSTTPALTMAFKFLQAAEGHGRRLDRAEPALLVRAGMGLENGVQSEAPNKREKAAA
jgi:hypothetical protein